MTDGTKQLFFQRNLSQDVFLVKVTYIKYLCVPTTTLLNPNPCNKHDSCCLP